ncbi:MAG: endonuclease/exonuclease/phosphatase family protein [Phycisphaerae bacterium]|nr:endonuclease/exonuclease/phosphatase family protein [Phycisphaerae bacterium]
MSRSLIRIGLCWVVGLALPTLGEPVHGTEVTWTSPGTVRLRVLSYNIRHGEGMDGKLDLARIAKVIRSLKPDLVALQEEDRKTRRTRQVDQAAELGRLTGMHAVFGKAIDHDGGEYGEAVLSRWPIKASSVHSLPIPKGGEVRALLVVEPDARARLRFCGTHLCHQSEENRSAQVREINKILVKDDEVPTILVGDLNARPNEAPFRELARHWTDPTAGKDNPTFPSGKPSMEIDYILLRPGRRFCVREARVVEEPAASDHRPILAVVEILPDSGRPADP